MRAGARGGSARPPAIDPPTPGYTRQISQYTVHMTVRCGRQPGHGACERRAEEEEHVAHEVKAAPVEWNPAADRLRELAEKMPNAVVTEFGNVAVKARVDSRSTRSTYIVEDSTNATKQTMTRAEFDRIAAAQDAYIADSHVVVVDGYIGSDPGFRTRARLIMEAANANVAGMQQQLYYPVVRPGDMGTRHDGRLHAQPSRSRLPGRPGHRRRPRGEHHPGAQLRLLR